ncbi:SURF1-like protein (fragment) [Shewanella benthica]|uniref:SURF1-like protein n=1 Tax=Shewanella benthica TaxID=43661 RepID=A0A330M0R4_9GAMM
MSLSPFTKINRARARLNIMNSSSSTKATLKIINRFIGYPHIESWGSRAGLAMATLEWFIYWVKLGFGHLLTLVNMMEPR